MKLELTKLPDGQVQINATCYNLYLDMCQQEHLLLAGMTGSGKSTVLNGIIATIVATNTNAQAGLILLDAKRVSLVKWKNCPHCMDYSSDSMERSLDYALRICDDRFREMSKTGELLWSGKKVYVIIDELADLMFREKESKVKLQRLMCIARASGVKVIAGTQVFLASVVPTPIKANFMAVCCCRTRSAQDSRNVLGIKGAEALPRFNYNDGYGECLYLNQDGINNRTFMVVPEDDIDDIINKWLVVR